MRRLYAFIVTALTLIAIAVINLTGIVDNMNLGIEFKGGFEILYQVLDSNGNEYSDSAKAAATESAAEVIAQRVDIAGVKNPQIEIEEPDYVRITVASKSETGTEDIRQLLSSNAEITFRDSSNNLLATSDELLEINGAKLAYQDGSPIVQLAIADGELWAQITSQVFNSEDPRIIIWLGFEEQYESENEYGFSGDSYADVANNAEAANKIISDATLEEAFDANTTSVIISGSFDAEAAAKMANLIKAGSIDFRLDEVYVSSVGATYGTTAFQASLVAGLIGLIAVCILLISFYGIGGAAASICLVIFVTATLGVYNLLKGEYGPDTIAATVISIGMAVDANIISFERTKDELYRGRPLRKAFDDGNVKSLSSIIDANVTTLIAALALYIFGTRQVKGFATMLIISIFFTVLIMVGLAKLFVSLAAKSSDLQKHPELFGANKKYIPDVEKGETQKYFGKFKNLNIMKHAKKGTIIPFLFIVGSFIVSLGTSAVTYFVNEPNDTNNSNNFEFLNLGLQFHEGTKLYFVSFEEVFSDTELATDETNGFATPEDRVINWFKSTDTSREDGISLLTANDDPYQVTLGSGTLELSEDDSYAYRSILSKYSASYTDGDKSVTYYTISMNWKYELDEDVIELIDNYFEEYSLIFYDEDNDIKLMKVNYSLNFVSPVVAAQTVENALWSLLLASLLIILYVALRYKITYSFAAIIALIHDSLITFAIFALFKIEINIEFVSAILAIIGYSVNDTIVVFDRIREEMATNKEQLDGAKRMEIANTALNETLFRNIITSTSTLLTILALLFFGSEASINFNIAMLIGLIAGVYSTIVIAPYCFLTFETMWEKFKAKNKAKPKTEVKKSNEPSEYVFYGIND